MMNSLNFFFKYRNFKITLVYVTEIFPIQLKP